MIEIFDYTIAFFCQSMNVCLRGRGRFQGSYEYT